MLFYVRNVTAKIWGSLKFCGDQRELSLILVKHESWVVPTNSVQTQFEVVKIMEPPLWMFASTGDASEKRFYSTFQSDNLNEPLADYCQHAAMGQIWQFAERLKKKKKITEDNLSCLWTVVLRNFF